MDWQDLSLLLTRPIAYHRIFATIGGGACAGLFLSQAFYWSGRTNDPDGWFYKTQVEWEEETGLTRREQETVRKQLTGRGLIEIKKQGIPCKLYYRVVSEVFIQAIEEAKRAKSLTQSQFVQNVQTSLQTPKPSETQYVENQQTCLAESAKQEVAKAPNYLYTEITPEISSEINNSLSHTLSHEPEPEPKPEQREREFLKPKPKAEEAIKKEAAHPLDALSADEREPFEKFVRAEWLKVQGKEIISFHRFMAIKKDFDVWHERFLKSAEGRKAKQEAIAVQYDWENHPDLESLMRARYYGGVPWTQEIEAEREWRTAFFIWSRKAECFLKFARELQGS